jgi:tripartite-type tricarboxylate transporter receptor subunit TctC
MAPRRTPPDLVRRINADVVELLQSKEVIEAFAAQGAEPFATRPDEFAALLKADIVKWGNVVKASGATVD